MAQWLKKRLTRSLLIISFVFAGVICTILFSPSVAFRFSGQWLLWKPEPLPTYLRAVAPFPGSEFPTDEYSRPYWFDVHAKRGICVQMNSGFLLSGFSGATEPQSNYKDDTFNRIHLYLNGQSVYEIDDLWPDPENRFLSKISASITPYPVSFCWEVKLPTNLYLAEVVIQSYKDETLHYRWAFRVK